MDEASHWNTLKELFEQALSLPPAERTAFLETACRDAPALRADLSALLDCHEEASAFFDALARSLFSTPEAPSHDPRLHPAHRDVGHYRIVERLGGGGMGVVYKARDTKLGRHVALKFLPPHLSSSDDAKHRFVHEAQSASALDHANIATIHEVGETDDGHLFIAMAYYEGETLKKKIERGPVPVHEALDYAAQVARGLAQAHAHGIVHRDIKPANVIVTEPAPAGLRVAKILDFGLAKMADLPLTAPGTMLGTVAYMSPEQARGEAVDHRTDVWSLGVTLYEMLTGERPFRGDYPQAVIYAIRNEEPAPLAAHNPDVPPDLEPLVRRCLEKDPALRYPGMAELLADLAVWTQPAAPALGRTRAALVAGLSVALTLALLLAVAPVREAVLSTLGIGGTPGPMHLAVLPLLPAGADSSGQAYTSGLAETLAGTLARLERPEQPLRVVPTQDLHRFGVTNPAEAHERLGATLAVIVFAERGADSVRVALDLVDAATQRPRARRDIAHPAAARGGLANELVAALVGMLGVDLTPAMERVLTAGTTTAPDAERFYTLGRGLLQRYQEARNIDEAIRHFEQA
ncbi:MAG: serine/threonine-protein kinase, partial [Rhodothermales bacterium]|nr:serine/threonine-protein kinase [Rhodothermales bacterium]